MSNIILPKATSSTTDPDTKAVPIRYYGLHLAAPFDRRPEVTQEEVKMHPYDLMAIIFAFPAFIAGGVGVGSVLLMVFAPLGVPLWILGFLAAAGAFGSICLVMGFFHKLDYKQHKRTGFRHVHGVF